jgi:hypothetical protein
MYVHDKGEEFYLHYDFWPKVPFIHHTQEEEYFADIVVRKELEIQQEGCKDGNYNYFSKYLFGKIWHNSYDTDNNLEYAKFNRNALT